MATDTRIAGVTGRVAVGTIGHIDRKRRVLLVTSLSATVDTTVLSYNEEVYDEFSTFGETQLRLDKCVDIKPEPYYTKFNKSRKKGSRNGHRRRNKF